MNRIVREHYPVEKLPEDLREPVADERSVRVVLELEEGEPGIAPGASGHFSQWKHLRRSHFEGSDEIVAHVRALRDEWDRR